MTALVLDTVVATADLETLATMKNNIDAMIAKLKADQIEADKAAKIAAKVAKIEAKAAAKMEAAKLRAELGETRGRPEGTATFDNKWGIVEGLKIIEAHNGQYHYNNVGAQVSRVLTLQLVDRGYVVAEKLPNAEGQRGRAKLVYKLTGKGRSYLALSAKWKQ